MNFEEQLQQISTTLYPFAKKLTNDEEAAKDLIQETLLKALSNKQRFQMGTNLKGWLYTIMKNTHITGYHKAQKQQSSFQQKAPCPTIVLNKASDNFMMSDIDQALQNLDPRYRVPFLMYCKGFKYHEIQDQLGQPLGTIKNRIHLARKLLQQQLTSYK